MEGDVDKLREHFEYASEFPDTDLSTTAQAIIDMIPYLSEHEAGAAITTMLIISHGTASGPKKMGYARQILQMLRSQYPDIYQRKADFHGY